MIYLVSNQKQLFTCEDYKELSPEESVKMILSWERVQFDTETTGRNPHICKLLSAQFGNKQADTQIVVDCTTVDFNIYKEVLETKLIIGHNLKFDCQFCYKYKIVPRKVWDTMIIEQLLHLGYNPKNIRYSLQAVEERRLHKYIDKSTRGEIIWRGLDTKVIKYAAGDVVDLEDIMELQIEDCNSQHCYQGALLENAFVPVISYLEWCGIKLDVEKWQSIMKANEQQKEEAQAELTKWLWNYTQEHTTPGYVYEEVDYTQSFADKKIKELQKQHFALYKHEKTLESDIYGFRKWVDNPYFEKQLEGDLFLGYNDEPICTMNWNSRDMVIPLLQQMGFKTKTEDKKTGESKESMVDKLIKKQKGINDEFIDLFYNRYQKSVKVCSTYGQQYIDAINPITGRIHTTFKQLGASSGRMSCGNSTASDTDLAKYKKLPQSCCKYVQLQNLPSDDATRGSFIPDTGNLLCSCDYSALESRLGADIYNETSMIKEYLEGSGDIHSLTAKHCFPKELEGIEVKDIKEKRPDLRKKAKPVEFSQQFGGSARAIQNSLGCTMQEAKEIADNYNQGFAGISEFKAKGAKFVKEHGYIVICKKTGHKVYWEDWEKWREIEDTPYELRIREYTKEELREHNMAGSKWERLSLNSPTQGTGIIILKFAMVKFYQWIIDNNLFEIVRLCDLVHDEVVVEFPELMKDIVPTKLQECMEYSSSIFCDKLPIPAVPETGDHWIH
jgi:DNA polymerase I-like protein with 3'-5' exonuclease and polymerase domains